LTAISPSDSEVKNLIQQGVDSINVGELDRAQNILTEAVRLAPLNPDSSHLLGIVLLRKNQELDLAIEYINKALEIAPDQPLFLNSLGTAYWQAGKFQKARDAFKTVVALKPDYVEAQYNLANCYRSLGELDNAIHQYQVTVELEPGFAVAYNDLGIVYDSIGQFEQAIEQFELAIELAPSRYEFYVSLAQTLQSKGELDEALIALQNAISLSPDNGRLVNNLGTIYLDQGNIQEATNAFARASMLLPEFSVSSYNLGYAQHLNANYGEAIGSFDIALSADPDWASAWVNRSNSLYMAHRYKDAIAGYQKALDLEPELSVAHRNIGSTYRRLKDNGNAILHFTEAIKLEPNHAKSHLGIAMAYLQEGEFSKAWRHYEWRFEATDTEYIPSSALGQTLWRGESVNGKTLLVIGEQGAGDQIHFGRFTQSLAALGATILFVCSTGLSRLFERSENIQSVYEKSGDWPTEYDYYIPLISVPRVLDTSIDSIPDTVPYIQSDPEGVKFWKARLNADRFNIGLVWGGNPDQVENQYRSCALSDFAPLFQLDGCEFYSLQKGDAALEVKNFSYGNRLIDYTNDLSDFADTADFVQALDLIITIDTSTAHLAGALGKPVWTILWVSHCWRYLKNRIDSPWYPSMRLFTQPELADWKSVIEEVKDALMDFTERDRIIK